MNTPIAFLIFNRPDLTQRVFEAISQVRPRTLLVVADGPRATRRGEVELCAQARKVIDQVDWPCDVHTDFSSTNLGCRTRVASGISWVFSQVPEAIILEDDCLPHPAFFSFCSELLERYRDDRRVMHVGGVNFQSGVRRTPYSYYFSKYTNIWGWATWRRAWSLYDVDIGYYEAFKSAGGLSAICSNALERLYWQRCLDAIVSKSVDTWDFQWNFACWSNGGLAITPEANLVSNIGFRSDATHTPDPSPHANMPTCDLGPLLHPPHMFAHPIADEFSFEDLFGKPLRKELGFTNRLRQQYKRAIRWMQRGFRRNPVRAHGQEVSAVPLERGGH